MNKYIEDYSVDVSIVITNYNREKFLDRAIRSCLDQIVFRRRFEVIIVDDGSNDNSLNILNKYRDDRDIVIIISAKNRGVAAASNLGVKSARGRYWIRVDSDDFLNKMAVNYMIDILDENPDIAFVYTDHYRVDELGFKQDKIILNDELLFEYGAGVMFRLEKLREIGGYDEKLRNCEDFDLLVKYTRKNKGFHLPLPLYRHYLHGNNLSQNNERNKYKSIVRNIHGI